MVQLSPFHFPKSPPSILAFLFISSVTLASPSLSYTSEENESGYGGGLSKTEVTLHEMGQPKERPKNLTCHVCYSETNSECMNFSSFLFPQSPSLSVDRDDGETDNEVHSDWNRDTPSIGGYPGFPQQCQNESYICSVRKFAFSLSNGTGHAPMKTFAIKRNCTLANKCEPGCVVMGERTRIYVCSTCCASDLCNIGNGAEILESISFWNLACRNMVSFFVLSFWISP